MYFSKINPDKLINFYCVGSGPDKKTIKNLFDNNKLRILNFIT